MSFYETWITTKYGVITVTEAKGGFVEIHVAAVAVTAACRRNDGGDA